MNNDNDKLDQAFKAFAQGAVPAGPSDDLIQQTLERIQQTKPQTNPFLERILTMKPLTKIAAAAIVIISVSAVFLFPTGDRSIALADVYSKVQQIRAFMYQMSVTMTVSTTEGATPQNLEMETIATVSTEYGVKMENTLHMHIPEQDNAATQLMYIIPKEKKMVTILPDEKAYMTMELSDDQLEEMQQKNNDPREMIRQMLKDPYTDLGFSEINGVNVQGFQTIDPESDDTDGNLTMTIWVNVDTGLPVRYEIYLKMENKMESHVVIDRFQWNVPVTAADFEYTIPDDYTTADRIPEVNNDPPQAEETIP